MDRINEELVSGALRDTACRDRTAFLDRQGRSTRKVVIHGCSRLWVKLFKLGEVVLVAALAGAATSWGTLWLSGGQAVSSQEMPRVWHVKVGMPDLFFYKRANA